MAISTKWKRKISQKSSNLKGKNFKNDQSFRLKGRKAAKLTLLWNQKCKDYKCSQFQVEENPQNWPSPRRREAKFTSFSSPETRRSANLAIQALQTPQCQILQPQNEKSTKMAISTKWKCKISQNSLVLKVSDWRNPQTWPLSREINEEFQSPRRFSNAKISRSTWKRLLKLQVCHTYRSKRIGKAGHFSEKVQKSECGMMEKLHNPQMVPNQEGEFENHSFRWSKTVEAPIFAKSNCRKFKK